MSSPAAAPGAFTPGERLLAGVLAAAAAALVVAWATGQLAALLVSGHALRLSLAELIDVVTAWPQHATDPRGAWPPGARDQLPGAAGIYLALAAILALSAAAAWTTWRLAHQLQGRAGGRAEQAARWARTRDLRGLVVRGPAPGRVTLGRVGGRLVAAEALHSVLVVAPTGMGKTVGLAVPAVLEWEGPVIATSIKTDLIRDTWARRAALGEVKVFDPAGASGLPRASWTPLGAAGGWQAAREQARRLVRAAQPAGAGADAEFWARQGWRYTAPLLLAATRAKRTIGDVLEWVQTNEQDDVLEALGGAAIFQPTLAPELRAAQAALESIWTADERLQSSVRATAEAALDAYADPTVLATATACEITPDWLLAGANTLYLYGTAKDQERFAPLFVCLLDEIIASVYQRAARTGQPISPTLLLVLDEAANLAPLPDLAQIAATGRGQGLQLVTVLQDLQQAEQRWPRQAETILNNHRAKLLGTGLADTRTLQYTSRLLGDQPLTQTSTTRGEHGRNTTTHSEGWRALAPANVLREAPDGTAVLVYGTLPPARLRLRPFYNDPHLRRLASTNPAHNAPPAPPDAT